MSLINDVREELQQLELSRKRINGFILVMLAASAFCWYIWQPEQVAYIFAGIAGLYFIIGLFFNTIIKPFYYLWMGLAFVLGWFMSRILLALIYYLILTPIGLILKLSGKALLEKSFNKDADSYWIRKNNKIDHNKMS